MVVYRREVVKRKFIDFGMRIAETGKARVEALVPSACYLVRPQIAYSSVNAQARTAQRAVPTTDRGGVSGPALPKEL
jgi:hypothetical protein